MREKLVILALCIFMYIMYSSYSNLINDYKSIQGSLNTIFAYQKVLKERLDIKDTEIEQKEYEIMQYSLNQKAMNGTDCIRCHLEKDLMFPIRDHTLSFNDFKHIVRIGITDKMPSYADKPTKTIKDITDSELKRMYEILKPLKEKDSK